MSNNKDALTDSGTRSPPITTKMIYHQPQITELLTKEEILGADNLQSESNSGYYS